MIKYTPDAITVTTTNDDGSETIETGGFYTVDSAADLDELFKMFGIRDDEDTDTND